MARTSLESGMSSSKSSKAAPKSKGGELDRNQKIKLIVSVSVIALVAVFIVFQQGWISIGGEKPPPLDVSPEIDQEVKERIQKQQNAPPPRPTDPVRTGSQ